jgi:hypothetical protein
VSFEKRSRSVRARSCPPLPDDFNASNPSFWVRDCFNFMVASLQMTDLASATTPEKADHHADQQRSGDHAKRISPTHPF